MLSSCASSESSSTASMNYSSGDTPSQIMGTLTDSSFSDQPLVQLLVSFSDSRTNSQPLKLWDTSPADIPELTDCWVPVSSGCSYQSCHVSTPFMTPHQPLQSFLSSIHPSLTYGSPSVPVAQSVSVSQSYWAEKYILMILSSPHSQ